MFEFQKTDRANLMRFTANNNTLTVASIAYDISDDGPFADSVKTLIAKIREFMNEDGANASRLKPETRVSEMGALIERTIAPVFRNLIAEGLAEKRAIATAEERMLKPIDIDTNIASEIRARFNAMTMPKKPGFIATATLQQTSAILLAGHQNTVCDAKLWETLEERHMLLAHIAFAGLQARHQRQGTVDEPLCSGPDEKAALAEAKNALAIHRQRAERVEELQATLVGIINVLANAMKRPRNEAFDLLRGA